MSGAFKFTVYFYFNLVKRFDGCGTTKGVGWGRKFLSRALPALGRQLKKTEQMTVKGTQTEKNKHLC